MTTDQIITLLQAGFTKAEIEAMDAGTPEPETEPESEPEAVTEPEAATEPEAVPDVAAQIAAAIEPLQQQIRTLTGILQQQNRDKARSQPGAAVTVESVVADFFGQSAKGGKT